jgi:hypothetical protein
MTNSRRQWLLRLNAAYIGGVAAVALPLDIMAAIYGTGALGRVLGDTPSLAIGFVEAHGLALLLSIVIWRARPSAAMHLLAMAMEVLLGSSNLGFWQLFVQADALVMGYVTTILHWLFAAAQGAMLLATFGAPVALDAGGVPSIARTERS